MNSKSGQPTNTRNLSRGEFLMTTEEGQRLIEKSRAWLSKALV
jgi:hypothetical protein